MQNKELHFNNGKFRILQIADPQEVSNIHPDTIRLISAALDITNPDLVVLTGDQIKGYSSILRVGDTKAKVEAILTAILKPVTDRNIPFSATFGNHDDECGVSKKEQIEIYKSLPNFVYEDSCKDEEGTFALNVDNKAIIWLFDSHRKDGHGGPGAVTENQLNWYRSIRDSYEQKLGYTLPGFAFQHIPTPEFYDVIKKVKPFSQNSTRAYGPHKNTWYAIDKQNSNPRDFMKEPPSPPYINTGEIDAFLEKKDVKALFVGHNHNTSFVAKYKDIYLSITQGCGFNVYGPGLNRGVRYIDIYEDGTFETDTITFGELFGNDIQRKFTYAKQAIAPVSVAGVKTKCAEIGALLAVAYGIASVIKYKKK